MLCGKNFSHSRFLVAVNFHLVNMIATKLIRIRLPLVVRNITGF